MVQSVYQIATVVSNSSGVETGMSSPSIEFICCRLCVIQDSGSPVSEVEITNDSD
jgi:hypothetical protein